MSFLLRFSYSLTNKIERLRGVFKNKVLKFSPSLPAVLYAVFLDSPGFWEQQGHSTADPGMLSGEESSSDSLFRKGQSHPRQEKESPRQWVSHLAGSG